MRLRMFWLYRPTAPSIRAQSIQVVHAAHASAARGHAVTVCVQAARPGVTAAEVLRFYGLQPLPELDLRVLPAGNTLASVAFRATYLKWAVGGGVVVARSKRYADQAIRWAPGSADLILEAHEVDSLQAAERGENGEAMYALESRVLGAARGVVCNCEGTAELLVRSHPDAPEVAVLHNATHPDRFRHPGGPGEGIGYTGSLRSTKDPAILADAARLLGRPVTVVGEDEDRVLVERSNGWLRFETPMDHHRLPDRLAQFAVLALPVGRGLFGERLTSPLKLWDYLAVGRPIVAADTPALRVAAGDAAAWYPVGDAAAFARVLERVSTDTAEGMRLVEHARQRVRTWGQRAEELDHFLARVLT